MVRPRKRLTENNQKKNCDKLKDKKNDIRKQEIAIYIKLVKVIKKTKNTKEAEQAFGEILKMMGSKIDQISYKFKIPGMGFQDVKQEALYALRYKAVKDYDQGRSQLQDISPFDRFAMLCIRRHLSTRLKSSYQNKSRVLNFSTSLDQDRNNNNDDSTGGLFLSDIVPQAKLDIFSIFKKTEYNSALITKLFEKLSSFEKKVFILHFQRYSYYEIAKYINKNRKKYKVDIKSIDNALSRIKIKAKEVYKLHGQI